MLWTGQREAGRDRDRIVNLSDGIFAIAITLLVLDIHVPDIPENLVTSELPAALLALWPKYLGYFLSFVGISIFTTFREPKREWGDLPRRADRVRR